MKALIKKDAGPGLQLVDVPEPVPGHNEVLIKVLQTGICGTDLHIYQWDEWAGKVIHPPLVPGHEFVGSVVWCPEGSGLAVGMLVGAEGHLVCGECRHCQGGLKHLCANTTVLGIHRSGAFAEYVVLPVQNVWRHDPGVDLDIATIFDPLGNAVHTATRFSLIGEDVLITGAGPIGLMASAICHQLGARHIVVTDPLAGRRKLAKVMGADIALDPQAQSLLEGRLAAGVTEGFTIGLEMSGSTQALEAMIEHAAPGCRIAALGLPKQRVTLDWAALVSKMIVVQGIYGRRIFATWHEMTSLLRAGLDICPVITNRFPYEQFEQAFAVASEGESGKVLIDWRI